MEFKKVEIENFGGISYLETEPKRVNAIIGPNGAGKSTFLKAIKFGLVGNTTRSNLIKDGKSKAVVEVDIDDYEIVKETTKKSTSVYLNGKRTTQKSIVEILEEEYGATKESMKFLTSSEAFDSFNGSDFTEFLLNSGIVPLTIDVNKFLTVCRTEESISSEIEEEIRKLFPEAPEKFGLDLMGEKNDELQILIKSNKKEAKRLENIVSQTVMTSTRSVDEIKREYDEVVSEEAKAKSYTDIAKKIERTQQQISDLQKAYTANSAVRPNPSDKTKAENEMKNTKESLTKTAGLIASFMSNNTILAKQLDRLETEKCPLSDKLICKQDKSEIKEEIKNTISNNENSITVLEMEKEEKEEQYNDAKKRLDDYNIMEREYMKKLSLKQQIDALTASLPTLPTLSPIDADVSERKRILSEELQIALQQEKNKSCKEELDKLLATLETQEILSRLTSKKGSVKAKILKMLLGTLVSSMNDMAAKLCPSLKIGLEVGDNGNVVITCSTPSGTQNYEDLSTGEKLMVQFLVMSQINLLSGFKILILDNLDKLDSNNFKNLLEFLLQPTVHDYFDHVFVATVNHEDFKETLADPALKEVNVIEI